MPSRLFSSLCFALLLVVGRYSSAADEKPTPSNDSAALFDQLDVNHDGQLTADEIPAEKKGLFERLLRLASKQPGGKLSRDEFIAQLKNATEIHPVGPTPAAGAGNAGNSGKPNSEKPGVGKPNVDPPAIDPERVFERLDSKHTGKISLADVPEQRRPLLKRVFELAGKPDGEPLTKNEFVKAFKTVLARRAAAGKPIPVQPAAEAKPIADNKPPAEGKPAPLAGNGEQRLKRLLKLSKRADGKLTKDDLPEQLRDRFDKIDANHDGLIDETELRDWIAQVQRRLQAAQSK
jgi:Ca2+-binding EF-hand superfamily protein